jgi:hypothetical protein
VVTVATVARAKIAAPVVTVARAKTVARVPRAVDPRRENHGYQTVFPSSQGLPVLG